MMHPTIEEALVGASVGEEKTVDVAFAADWRVSELAGKDATVSVKVTRVAEPTLPALDKAFIERFGVRGGDLEAFRKDVRRKRSEQRRVGKESVSSCRSRWPTGP